jgi:hypothetical protein
VTTRNWIVIALHIVVTAALAGVSAIAAYHILNAALGTARAETLQSYIRVRAEREQFLFDEARVFVEAAEQAFRRRLAHIGEDDVNARFDDLFPPFGDGTRRSAPDLFDGLELPGGDYVFGIGAFLAEGERMTQEEKRRYLAAFHAVRSVGEAHLGTFSSLYYFTPDRRALLFAPGREDRLEFYRFEAPADFDLEADEDPRLFSRQTNPLGEMQCTRLSRFVYSDGGERSATACRMPMWEGDELLGAFGTSIMMTEHLVRALEAPPAGGVNMMFDREGSVIARGQTGLVADRLAIDPMDIMALLRDDPRPRGIVRGPDAGHLIAFSRIDGPDWYFVSVVPLDDIEAASQHWAAVLFAIVFVCSMLFAGLRGLIRRWRPVRRLIRIRRSPSRGPDRHRTIRFATGSPFSE